MWIRNASRSRRLVAMAAAVATVAALSACGADIYPGTAASVNGTKITDQTIEDLSAAACTFTVAQAKADGTDDGKPSLVVAELKSSLLDSLIAFRLTDEVVEKMDLSLSQAQIEKASQQQGLPEGMPEDQGALIEDFFQQIAKNQLQQALIGVHLRDRSLTTVDDATQADVDAAQKYLDAYFAKADVEVAPSYGNWDGARLEQGTGSLSDPVSTTAAEPPVPGQPNPALESLPPTQVCG